MELMAVILTIDLAIVDPPYIDAGKMTMEVVSIILKR
jgi:hypothetical protein